MKKRGRSKSATVEFAPPELVTLFFERRRDIVMECVGRHLTLQQLSTLLQCNQTMYNLFSTPTMLALRECQRRYGAACGAVAGKWMKRCIKLRSLAALTFVLDQVLHNFLFTVEEHEDHFDASMGLEYATVGFKLAFRLGYHEAVELLLQWNMNLHKLHGGENTDVNRLFYHGASADITLASVLPDALRKGSLKGHGTLVRQFIEKHCPALQFSTVDPKSLQRDDVKDLAFDLLFGCVSNADTQNFDFFLDLYQQVSFDAPTQREDLFHELVLALLQRGKNPKMLAFLCQQTQRPSSWEDYSYLLHYAKKNLRVVMMQHVISITSKKKLMGLEITFRKIYGETEQSLRKAIAVMQMDIHSKKACKFVERFQQRLKFLKSTLERIFKVKWEEEHPSYKNDYQMESASGFLYFSRYKIGH